MIEQIYLYLIVTGATIGAVLFYLWRQSRTASRINLDLIRLNERHKFDALAFLRDVWPLLSEAGLRGMRWRMDWFGVPVEGQAGQLSGTSQHRDIQVTEMKLAITLYQPNTRDERRYFNETLIETFLLLLRTDMLIKAGTTDATFAQMSKLNLFLQHDIKNIAQFIQLMADQLAAIPAGKEPQVLNYLREAAPIVRHRADRIVRTLTVGEQHPEPTRTIELRDMLAEICGLYQLDHEISGSAEVHAPVNTLDSALDNILKNYSDMTQRDIAIHPFVSLVIANKDEGIEIIIGACGVPVVAHTERLFEPFWSSDPAGLGIGLYQAKQMLESCHATLSTRLSQSGQLQFRILFPHDCA